METSFFLYLEVGNNFQKNISIHERMNTTKYLLENQPFCVHANDPEGLLHCRAGKADCKFLAGRKDALFCASLLVQFATRQANGWYANFARFPTQLGSTCAGPPNKGV